MKIASFNVENMFRRAVALNQENWDEGKPILEAYAALSELLQNETYSDDDKKRILELVTELGLDGSEETKFVVLRRSRGKLFTKHKDGSMEVVAKGRGDWIGWLEMKRQAVDEAATRNTAAVIADIDPDILAVVEAEDRPALVRFNEDVLKLGFADNNGASNFAHVMLIDGNDDRGIDVGLFTKTDSPVIGMRSHVDDPGDHGEPVFSRDCAEYEIEARGQKLLLMVNHFKSKGYGPPAVSSAKRRAQATRVADIYRKRTEEGWEQIVVLGDLNDTPDSEPLAPLVNDTTLKDASEDPSWVWGEREGTFGGGNEKIDYLLLSPALFGKVKGGGVDRKGVWHGSRTHNPWEMLPTLTSPTEAASDHAAVWVELDI